MCIYFLFNSLLLVAQNTTKFGAGSGSIFLSSVVCYGAEDSILDCFHDIASKQCKHSQDVGIICEGIIV